MTTLGIREKFRISIGQRKGFINSSVINFPCLSQVGMVVFPGARRHSYAWLPVQLNSNLMINIAGVACSSRAHSLLTPKFLDLATSVSVGTEIMSQLGCKYG